MTSVTAGNWENSSFVDVIFYFVDGFYCILFEKLGWKANKIVDEETTIFGRLCEELFSWFAFDDFQLKLLKGFLIILAANIFLIFLAWKIYGSRISDKFMKPASSKLIEDLRKSFSELKLPKEHSPRV